MYTVDVLIEGYAKIHDDGSWQASSTVTLITTPDDRKILVDPGINRELLLSKLKKRGLSVDSIDLIFLTHSHPDHAALAGIFPRAVLIDSEAIYEHDTGIPVGRTLPDTEIEITATHGHTSSHASLLVPTEQGTVAVAGDVFWWQEGQEQIVGIESPDAFAENQEKLMASRQKLLYSADIIIPGHGRMFRVMKK